MKTLDNAVAVSGEHLPDELRMGALSFFRVPEEPINGATFAREWAANGLDTTRIPETRQPVDVARSAMASVRTRRGEGKDGRVEIRSDEVEKVGGTTCYQITRAVWDTSERVIEHEKAMRMCFDGQQISTEPLGDWGGSAKDMRELERAVIAHFEANAKTTTGDKIRKAVRRTITDQLTGQRMAAGGVYFVPKSYVERDDEGVAVGEHSTQPLLDGLKATLDAVYGDRAGFYSIPLANGNAEQEMVRTHFAINANERARDLFEKAQQRVRQVEGGGRMVRSDFLANLLADRRRLLGEVDQFEQLVSAERSDISVNLAELDEAIDKLEALVDGAGA